MYCFIYQLQTASLIHCELLHSSTVNCFSDLNFPQLQHHAYWPVRFPWCHVGYYFQILIAGVVAATNLLSYHLQQHSSHHCTAWLALLHVPAICTS